jgi:hypothetical protein
MDTKTIFEKLQQIDVTPYIKSKNPKVDVNDPKAPRYLPWSKAWELLNTADLGYEPTYKINEDEQTGQDFFISEVGVYVKVSVSIGSSTHTVNLAVTDGTNRAMKADAYSYTIKSYGKEQQRTVAAVTVVDIQNTQQRALTKAIALHGLGLNLWTGDDFDSNEPVVTTPIPRAKAPEPRATVSVGKTENMKKELKEGDDYWDSVCKGVESSKQSWAVVQNRILAKYTVDKETKEKLKSLHHEHASKQA